MPGFMLPSFVVIVVWLLTIFCAFVLIIRKQIRILKSRFGTWSPTRTVYFVGAMGNVNRELVRNIDGPLRPLGDDEITAFMRAQRKCFSQWVLVLAASVIPFFIALKIALPSQY